MVGQVLSQLKGPLGSLVRQQIAAQPNSSEEAAEVSKEELESCFSTALEEDLNPGP